MASICRAQVVDVEDFFLRLVHPDGTAAEKRARKADRDAWITEMHAAILAQPVVPAPTTVVQSATA